MRNAEKDQQEERERIERRRKEDEEAYERVRSEGLIEGLQLSDESDEEEERFSPLISQGELASPPGKAQKEGEEEAKEVVASAGEAVPAVLSPSVAVSPPPTDLLTADRPPLPETISSNDTLETAEEGEEAGEADRPDLRPRADTQPSIYAESTYSTTSSSAAPPLPSPPQVLAEPAPAPVPVGGVAVVTSTPSAPVTPLPAASTASGTVDKPEEEDSVLSTLRDAATSTTTTIAAGATAAVAGLGAAIASAGHNPAREASPEPETQTGSAAPIAVPKEARSVLADVAEEEVVAAPVDISAAETAPQPPVSSTPIPHPAPLGIDTSLSSSAASSSAPPSSSAVIASAAGAGGIAPSVTASPSSAAFSRSTAGTSAPASESGTGGKREGKELPADPMSWDVQEVVEWARQKGFDKLTVSKFEGALFLLSFPMRRD